jgi:predicted O-methyltransferase YrrM
MKGFKRRIGKIAQIVRSSYDRRRFSKYQHEYSGELSFTDAIAKFRSRNQLYAYFHHYFFHHLPPAIREHRDYFCRESRGFGEEAFHSMWYMLIKEFKPKQFLEIGVYRGQVISLWALIGKLECIKTDIHCISPFKAISDSVSNYQNISFLDDVLLNFREFGLPAPRYVEALSTDPRAVEYMKKNSFDCIYIDGSHDYEVVLADYRNSVASLKPGGILVMDDSSLGTDFSPPKFSFAGHPGPSRVAREFADRELVFLAGVGHQNVYRRV